MADEADDLEYSETNVGSAQAQGVRKNISLKLKGKGRGRGRKGTRGRRGSVKKVIGTVDEEDIEEIPDTIADNAPPEKPFDSNLDEVISKLEAPAFSPMDRAFPEPLHQNKKLRWDHKVNLIGEKVIDPMIHCCEKCCLPILNYGRMMPCKHVFCYDCARKHDKHCSKCDDKVVKVEQSALGTVFMCTFGGTRHEPGACGRTYLSQRDLQAHVNHRHQKPPAGVNPTTAPTAITTQVSTAPSNSNHIVMPRDPRDPRAHLQVDVSHQPIIISLVQHAQEHREPDHSRNQSTMPPNVMPAGSPVGQQRQYPHSPASYPSTIPVSSARPNLITVPIQDDGAASHPVPQQQHIHPPSHGTQFTPAPAATHPIPPMQHPPTNYPPPPHGYPHPLPPNPPPYSQAPPMTTQTFTQPPPPVHHQPPIHAPGGPIYSTPPPAVHHPPPPTNYNPPPRGPHPLPPAQHFPPPVSGPYEETPAYMQQWPPSGVPPPRAPLPPRPMPAPANPNKTLLQTPRNPDPNYRPPYYQ